MKPFISRSALALAVLVLLIFALSGSADTLEKRPVTPEDMVGITWLTLPQISPDGKLVAFVVTEPADSSDPSSRRNSDIWIVSTSGKTQPRRYAFGPGAENNPRWSPDGKLLAFLSDRESPEENQIFLLRTDGGEAEKLTSRKGGVRDFKWSPDGRRIAFTAKDSLTSQEESEQKRKDDEVPVDQNLKYTRLYEVDPETRDVYLLTRDNLHVSDFDWSPDGSRLALRVSDTPLLDDVYFHSRLVVLDRRTRAITTVSRKCLGNPAWSPDGSTIAFFHPSKKLSTNIPAIVPASGGKPKLLAQDYRGSVWSMRWLPGGKKLLVFAVEGVRGAIAQLDPARNEIATIKKVSVTYYGGAKWSMSRDGKMVAYMDGAPDHPEEVWVMESSGKKPRRLTNFNRQLEELALGTAERVHWNGTDGTRIEGVLFKPPGYDASKRYPTIVEVHGGPEWAWWYGWHGSWHELAQLFASNGYVVLLPNPRGSAGYGVDFAEANMGDWGGKDFEDILSGVDFLIKRGVADGSRMGICGWSYGGFMTAWAVTQTRQFKAAVAGAAVTDLVSFHGTTDITPSFLMEYFQTIPFVDPERFRERSAINFVSRAETPTLILHGEADERVPVGQAYEFYRGLKQTGTDAELVVYPREHHGFRERAHQIDVMRRTLAWFDRYLKGDGR